MNEFCCYVTFFLFHFVLADRMKSLQKKNQLFQLTFKYFFAIFMYNIFRITFVLSKLLMITKIRPWLYIFVNMLFFVSILQRKKKGKKTSKWDRRIQTHKYSISIFIPIYHTRKIHIIYLYFSKHYTICYKLYIICAYNKREKPTCTHTHTQIEQRQRRQQQQKLGARSMSPAL